MCARVGGANTTSLWRRISQSEIRNSAAEKIGIGKRGRAKIPSPQPPSLPARAIGFQNSGIRIFVKSSNFVQKTPPIFTFVKSYISGAKRLGMIFFRNFEGIFEIQNQSAVGNVEVRRAKLWQNEILRTNLFLSPLAKG